jgi:HEAT repeat protein
MHWLTQRQLKSKQAETRRKAAAQLGRVPVPGDLKPLSEALGDEDAEVRRLAATALGRLEAADRVEPLLGVLSDRDPEVLKAAVLGLKRAVEERVLSGISPLLRHSDAGVRACAAQVLEGLGFVPATREEEAWLMVAKSQLSRAVMLGAVALPAIEMALRSGSSSVCAAAVDALGRLGDARALRSVIGALRSADPAVCVAAVDALRRLGDAQAVEPLIQALRHRSSQVRLAAVEALGHLRQPPAVEPVRALLADPDWGVRREAAEALGKLRDRRGLEALTQSLGDADGDVREAAANSLGSLADRRAIEPLVLALKDSTSGVRRIAAAALARIDPDWSSSPEARAAAEQLKPALNDEDPNVRHFVAQLLVGLGAMEAPTQPEDDLENVSSPAKRQKLAVSLFLAVLCDVDADLRHAAAEALGELGDSRAQSALMKAQADPDPEVRVVASGAIETIQARAREHTASASAQHQRRAQS